MSAALQCRGLTVAPGGAAVLRGLSLDVAAGERVAVVGPSGAGKTTLLRTIAGLERPLEGDVRLGGRSLLGVPPHRRRIAVVFQEPRLLPHVDVLDNVAFALRAAGVGRGERRRRAALMLDEVGLGGLHDRGTRGLSGGEQQRIALARALCAEPDLLLLDEPLAALDPGRREDLRRLVVRLTDERGLTTLVVTHDRSEAAELGRRIALLLEGRVVQAGPPRELFERPASAAVARFFGVANLLRGERGTLAIRPEHVLLADGGEDADLTGVVVESTYSGTAVKLVVDCDGRRVEAHVPPAAAPPAGARVGLRLPAEHLWPLEQAAGERDALDDGDEDHRGEDVGDRGRR